MGEIVNLRRVKKAQAAERRAREAEANRAAHGRTRAEKDAAEAERQRRERTLDGAAIERE